jgi:hypothetical protein
VPLSVQVMVVGLIRRKDVGSIEGPVPILWVPAWSTPQRAKAPESRSTSAVPGQSAEGRGSVAEPRVRTRRLLTRSKTDAEYSLQLDERVGDPLGVGGVVAGAGAEAKLGRRRVCGRRPRASRRWRSPAEIRLGLQRRGRPKSSGGAARGEKCGRPRQLRRGARSERGVESAAWGEACAAVSRGRRRGLRRRRFLGRSPCGRGSRGRGSGLFRIRGERGSDRGGLRGLR